MIDPAAPTDLGWELDGAIQGVRTEIGCMRQDLTALGHRLPAACNAINGILQRCVTVLSYVNSLDATAGAKRLTGEHKQRPAQERFEHMELALCVTMPCDIDSERRRLQQRIRESLHRAGDHSLDDDEPNDRNVSVETEEVRHGCV